MSDLRLGALALLASAAIMAFPASSAAAQDAAAAPAESAGEASSCATPELRGAAQRPSPDVIAQIRTLIAAGDAAAAACLMDLRLDILVRHPSSLADYFYQNAVRAFEDSGEIEMAERMQRQFVEAAAGAGNRIVLVHAQQRHVELLIRLGRHDQAEALLARLMASPDSSRSDIYRLQARNALAKGDRDAMRGWFERGLAELAPYPNLLPQMQREYAAALAQAGDLERADATYLLALAPSEHSDPGRPDIMERQIMAERAAVLARLGRREEARYYALPVRITAEYEQRHWAEAARLAEEMVALAPRIRADASALQTAHEFRAAARNMMRGNAPPPYEAPRALQLCGPWNPPRRPADPSAIPLPTVSGPRATGPESFNFAHFPVRIEDPDAALFRARDRYVSYAMGCLAMGRPEAAVTVLEGARQLLAGRGYRIGEYYKLLLALGDTHAANDNFEAADRAYGAVIERIANGDDDRIAAGDELDLAVFPTASMERIRQFYMNFGRYDRVELHLRRMLAAHARDINPQGSRILLLDLYLLQGRADEAFATLDEIGEATPPPLPTDPAWAAQVMARAPRQPNRPAIGLIQAWTLRQSLLARALNLTGDYAQAAEVVEQARAYAENYLQLLRQQGETVYDFDTTRTVAPLTVPLAEAYAALGRARDAHQAFRQAVQYRAQEVQARQTEEDARAFLIEAARFATSGVAFGDLVEAKRFLDAARDLAGRIGNPGDQAQTALWAASVSLGIVDPAERETALAAGQHLFARLERQWEIGTRSALDTEWQKRQLRTAGRLYSNHASLLWTVSEGGGAAARREEAFRSLQRAGQDTADLSIAMAAARALLARSRPGLVPLVEQRDALVTRYLAGTSDQFANIVTSAGELERIAAQLGEIDARIRRDAPDYFAMIRAEPLSTEQASALMEPDEAALLLVPGEFGTQIMAVTREGVTWRSSALRAEEIGGIVRRLLWFAGGNVTAGAAERRQWESEVDGGLNGFDRETAFRLYSELIQPILPAIRGRRHLFVSGAGALSSLPFAMLVSQAPSGRDDSPLALRETHWFGNDFALVQIPSLQALALFKRREARPADGGEAFAGFGDPLLGPPQARGGRGPSRRAGPDAAAAYARGPTRANAQLLADVRQLRRMPSLPGTRDELNAMASAFGAAPETLHLREAATERAIKTTNLSATRVLALATHGLTAGELPGTTEPGLVLTPPATASAEDDGLLTASEIALLRLDADWVILSACNTAAGDGSRGAPGLSGLARAFFYAGARSLLASHWPVRDDVAARLTVRTIEIARSNRSLSRAQAYQQAVREIRGETASDGVMVQARDGAGAVVAEYDSTWAHPNAWAPFTLIGDAGRPR